MALDIATIAGNKNTYSESHSLGAFDTWYAANDVYQRQPGLAFDVRADNTDSITPVDIDDDDTISKIVELANSIEGVEVTPADQMVWEIDGLNSLPTIKGNGGQSLNFGTPDVLDPTTMSGYSIWAVCKLGGSAATPEVLFGTYNGGSDGGVALRYSGTALQFFHFTQTSGAYNLPVSGDVSNSEVIVNVTFDTTEGSKMYIDNVLVDTDATTLSKILEYTQDWMLHAQDDGTARYSNQSISDIKVFTQNLHSTIRTKIYNALNTKWLS